MREGTKHKIKRFFMNLGIQTVLVLVAISCIFPLVWMVSSSFKTQETIFKDMSLIPKTFNLKNYIVAWTDGNFGIYLFNSIFYTITVVLGIVLVASLAAYGFSRLKFPGRNFFFFMFLASMMIPLPGAFVAVFVLVTKLGIANTRWGYILPQINGGLAMAIFLIKTFFDKMPKDLEDAARIDGCTKMGIYWHIALPLAKPALAVVIIFNALAVWSEYLWAMLVLSDKNLMPLQRGLMVFQGAHLVQYPILMAGITITVLPIIILYLMMQKFIIKGISAGALKG